MKIDELKIKYKELLSLEDSDDGIFEFKKLLLESDEDEIIQFHIDILNDRENQYLHRDIRSFFSKRKNSKKVISLILKKINEGIKEPLLLADLIQILGNFRSPLAKEIIVKEIRSSVRNIRYKCIIVLGWIGSNIDDLNILNERMLNDEDGQLRGYSATAMRQIWHNKKNTKNKITIFIKKAMSKENNKDALTGMILTIQELHKKKLGFKESNYGDVTGNVEEAKTKTIKMLEKL
ncbi:HEAT repeat domain-containing protein [Lacinutrix mariniflava]|uniref:HEAT repeat domain-containing protein n=1 Tax=Lacinutrix mariniflava TaxID=342955 RepID=UPI0006E357FE|nr:HEAT repeat domain-containing protein [Lacinutrix mariniflava]